MKKILGGLLVVLLILTGLIYYQRTQVARQLHALIQGSTYSSYGIKIQIPPAESSVQGWIRPYLNIPRLVIDLSAWGLGTPLQVEGAVVFQDLWGHSGLVLEVPRDWEVIPGITLSHPVFEIGAANSIKTVGAASLTFQSDQDPITLVEPQILLGRITGMIPDQWIFTVESIQGKNYEVAGVEFGLKSEVDQTRRRWTVYGLGAGGVSSPRDKVTVAIGGWEFRISGSVREMPYKQWWDSLKGLREQAKEIYENSKQSSGKLPNLDILFDGLEESLTHLSPKLQDQEFSWDGIKVTGEVGQEKLLVKPLRLRALMEESEGDLIATAEGGLDELRVQWQENKVITFKEFSLNQKAVYHRLNFDQLIHFFLSYYRSFLTQTQKDAQSLDIEPLLFATLAQYPNGANFNLNIGEISYDSSETSGDHKNFSLEFLMESREVGYRFSDNFELTYPQEPTKNMVGAKVRFALLFQIPWEGMVNLSRQAVQDPVIALDFFDIFGKQSTGFTLDLDLDLGPNYFATDIQSRLALPLGGALKGIQLPKNWQAISRLDSWGQKVWRKVVETYVSKGYFILNLKIFRLSKFQAWLDSWKSGSSLGLALVAPYVIVDTDKDSLAVKIEFKNSEIWVNDQVSSSLQNLIQPFLKKWGASLPETQPSP